MPHNRTPVPDQAVGDVLIVFVRLPVPGEVKTRLAKRLGPVGAADLYRAFAEWVFAHTVTRAGSLAALGVLLAAVGAGRHSHVAQAVRH